MNKKLAILMGSIGGAILIIGVTIALIIAASVNAQKTEHAYVDELNNVASVKHAFFELQHPGVPWNNVLVVFVAMDIQDKNQVAAALNKIREVSGRYIDNATSTHIYVVNSENVQSDRYADRSLYFKDFYIGDSQDLEIFQEAAKSIGLKTFENSVSY